MKTHAQELLSLVRNVNRDCIAIAGCDHTPNDFKDLLIRLGASVEVFLKDHVHDGANRRNFVSLIDDLRPLGLSAASRALLHDLRLAYNEAKHNPSYPAEIRAVLTVLRNAESALKEVTQLSVGTMQTPVSPSFRRLMWFAAWDHVIGGDTEVGIFLPAPSEIDMPYDLDGIYIDMASWGDAKEQLSRVGKCCIGPACVSERAYNFWSTQGDFLAAGSFEGDLRSMISALARFERVEDILPGAKRENQPKSMLAAALFAVVDLSSAGKLPQDAGEIADAIVSASADYAAPATSLDLRSFATRVAELVCSSQPVSGSLSGPIWVNSIRYAQLQEERVGQIESPQLMILNDGMLVARR
jgi:hypothetical protein